MFKNNITFEELDFQQQLNKAKQNYQDYFYFISKFPIDKSWEKKYNIHVELTRLDNFDYAYKILLVNT